MRTRVKQSMAAILSTMKARMNPRVTVHLEVLLEKRDIAGEGHTFQRANQSTSISMPSKKRSKIEILY